MTSLTSGTGDIAQISGEVDTAGDDLDEGDHGGHADAVLFGLANFLVADRLTFAAHLIKI